ncbi:hypothetical protein S83_029000, partial [Arachis hypogaea]
SIAILRVLESVAFILVPESVAFLLVPSSLPSSLPSSSFFVTIVSLSLPPKPLKNLNGSICQICGETVGLTDIGDVFIACNECAFPFCRPCYEY